MSYSTVASISRSRTVPVQPCAFRPLTAALLLALAGCSQVAWKTGGSAEDLKRDEQVCSAQAAADTAVRQCLQDKGWSISDFSAPPTAATAQPSPVAAAAAPARVGAGVAATPAATGTLQTAATSAPDPLAPRAIQTWWKAGGAAADFNVDANACVDQLGSAYQPDYAKHLYSEALVGCLEQRGWHAGYDPVFTPLR